MRFSVLAAVEKLTPFYLVVDHTLTITKAGNGLLLIYPDCINNSIDAVIDINIVPVSDEIAAITDATNIQSFFCTYEIHPVVLNVLKYYSNDIRESYFICYPTRHSYFYLKQLTIPGFDFSYFNNNQLGNYFKERAALIKDFFLMNKVIDEQKVQLVKEQKNFIATINSLNEAVFEVSMDGTLVQVSEGWKGVSGYVNDEVAGTIFLEYIYPPDVEKAIEYLTKIVTGQETYITNTIRGVRKDKQIVLLKFSIRPLYSNLNVIVGMTGVIEDITRKVETENRLNVILDNINDEIILSDVIQNYVYVSPSLVKNRGFESFDEFIGKKTSDNIHPEDFEKLKYCFLVEGKSEVTMDYRVKIGSAENYKWYFSLHKIVRDPISGLDYLLTVSSDISQRKNFERVLEILTENIADEVSMFDVDGNYLFASDSLIKNLGFSSFEDMKKNNAYGDFDKEQINDLLKKLSIEKVLVIEREREDKSTGNITWCENTIKVVHDNLTNVDFLIVVSRDINLRKLQEEQLRDNLKKELLLNKDKSDFITTISHEFRTPLAIIKTYVELIYLLEKTSPIVNSYVDTINSEVDRMLEMMKDAIMIEKINQKTISDEKIETAILPFLKETLIRIRETNKDRRKVELKSIKTNYNDVRINQEQIQRVIENLVSNSLKYSIGRPSPKVLLEDDDVGIKITVVDYGIGIPEEGIINIFNPFYRAKNTGSIPGTGLGLSIVKKIIDMHHGTISIRSVVGEGTTVIINLPY